MKPALPTKITDFLAGGGEMGKLIRAMDWSKTPLGSSDTWPQSLRTCIRIIFASRQPMFIWWGEQFIALYNDAYLDILRGKHPAALGAPAAEIWPEIWPQLHARLISAFDKNEGIYDESRLLILERNGYPEETYYTFSFTPVPDDEGNTGGILCTATDDTNRIVEERQLRTLKNLGKRLARISTEAEMFPQVIQILQENPQDFPFALLYQVQEDVAVLVGASTGVELDIIPQRLEFADPTPATHPFIRAIQSKVAAVIDNLPTTVGDFPSGTWQHQPEQALVLPIQLLDNSLLHSVLVIGLNPYRQLDETYQHFCQSVVEQIAINLTTIHAFKEREKQVEAALLKSEQKYRLLFNSIDEGFCVCEMIFDEQEKPIDYRFLEYNPLFEQHTGLYNALGKRALELLPDLETYWIETYGNIVLTGKPARFINGSDVMQRWFDVYAFPFGPKENKQFALVFNDITARKKIEQHLYESSERLRVATESAELGTWDFNPDTGELIWDKRSKELFGLSPDAFVDYSVFLAGLHPDDRERANNIINYALSPESGGEYDIKYRTVGLQDKKLRWLRATGKAFFTTEGKAYRFIGTLLDITDQKLYEEKLIESEEMFRRMSDTVPMMIWMTEPDASCKYLNRQWYEYTGQTPETGLGLGWLNAVHPDDAERLETIFMNAHRRRINFSLEYRLQSKTGNYRWMIGSGIPRFNEQGNFEGYVGAVVDIHDRKLAEEQKDAFMHIAGHELRTPLTSLLGFLALLLRIPTHPEPTNTHIKKAYDSALKMKGLISDFVDFSRAQQGLLSFEIKTFDFDKLVVETVENFHLANPYYDIHVQGRTEKSIKGDRGRIEQVIINLMNNAMKYSPGKNKIEILLHQQENAVALQIRDYGVGIEKEEMDKIFDKFHRASNTGKIKGMGLGLYIVKKIVDYHQGSVIVESEPGKGTSFTVILPVEAEF